MANAYGQAVWSCPLDAGVKPRVKSPGRRWLTSPIHRGDHGAAVQPSRRECRSIGFSCDFLCAPFLLFRTQGLRVRLAPGIPCALFISKGATLSAKSGRDRAAAMRTCEFMQGSEIARRPTIQDRLFSGKRIKHDRVSQREDDHDHQGHRRIDWQLRQLVAKGRSPLENFSCRKPETLLYFRNPAS